MTLSGAVDVQTQRELEALLTEFAYRADHGLAATVHELFIEDASIRGPGLAMQGRAEIAARFAERGRDSARVSRHLWSNPRFERLGKDACRVVTAVQTFIHRLAEGEALPATACTLVVGDSIDVIESCDDGRWRFRSRELVVAFRVEAGSAPGANG
jgi:hypothetical protein